MHRHVPVHTNLHRCVCSGGCTHGNPRTCVCAGSDLALYSPVPKYTWPPKTGQTGSRSVGLRRRLRCSLVPSAKQPPGPAAPSSRGPGCRPCWTRGAYNQGPEPPDRLVTQGSSLVLPGPTSPCLVPQAPGLATTPLSLVLDPPLAALGSDRPLQKKLGPAPARTSCNHAPTPPPLSFRTCPWEAGPLIPRSGPRPRPPQETQDAEPVLQKHEHHFLARGQLRAIVRGSGAHEEGTSWEPDHHLDMESGGLSWAVGCLSGMVRGRG